MQQGREMKSGKEGSPTTYLRCKLSSFFPSQSNFFLPNNPLSAFFCFALFLDRINLGGIGVVDCPACLYMPCCEMSALLSDYSVRPSQTLDRR